MKKRLTHTHRQSAGFSLIEVILATAILLGSVVVLSRLTGIGRSHAQNTQQHAEAQRVCETVLNEIVMGLRDLSAVEMQPLQPAEMALQDDFELSDLLETQQDDEFEPDRILLPAVVKDTLLNGSNRSRWFHSIRVRPQQETPGLVSVTVEVVSPRRIDGRRPRYSLTRWIRQDAPSDPFADFAGELL